LKHANNAIAGNSDEVVYPTPIPAKILGPFITSSVHAENTKKKNVNYKKCR